jgi:hypothetical protein
MMNQKSNFLVQRSFQGYPITIDTATKGKEWWRASEVSAALGYSAVAGDLSNVLRRHVEPMDTSKCGVHQNDSQ